MDDAVNQEGAGEIAASLSKSKRKQLIWPEPLIINPTSPHTHSIILLHGRGSNAERFGVELLKSRNSSGETLADCFPGAKFIFPTAKKRRSTVLKRIPINQWFDNFSLDDPSERLHLQYDGIRETSAFMHELIEKEVRLVGLSRVAIGGLSQGCAAALHVLLNYRRSGESHDDEVAPASKFAGFVGMSGWLPFADILDLRKGEKRRDEEEDEEEDDDIFGSNDGQDELEDNIFGSDSELDNREERKQKEGKDPESIEQRQLRAVNTARDIASLPPLSLPLHSPPGFGRTPIFLGHGRHDEKVSVNLGQQAKSVLEALGCAVRWRDYDEGHWYKVPDEIDDVVEFLREEAGFEMMNEV